jgi:hypothetical protein
MNQNNFLVVVSFCIVEITWMFCARFGRIGKVVFQHLYILISWKCIWVMNAKKYPWHEYVECFYKCMWFNLELQRTTMKTNYASMNIHNLILILF